MGRPVLNYRISDSPITNVKRRCVACQTHQPILGGTLKNRRFRCKACGPKRVPVTIDNDSQEVVMVAMSDEFPITDERQVRE